MQKPVNRYFIRRIVAKLLVAGHFYTIAKRRKRMRDCTGLSLPSNGPKDTTIGI